MDRSWTALVGLVMVGAIAVGCAPTSRSSDLGTGGPESYLPPSSCSECVESAEAAPPGFDAALACYDGCNWCYCTAEGLVSCTARFCGGDAEVGGDAGL